MKDQKKEGKEKTVGSKITSRLKIFAETLEEGVAIEERFTVRTIKLNLKPRCYSPELVKNTRESLHASQAIFAQFLGVSTSSVQDWEQGQSTPNGAACRLMDEIASDPEYWLARIQELAEPVKA